MGELERANARALAPNGALPRWTLHEIIGSGGSAVVYRASGSAGEPSALKVMRAHLSTDRSWVHRVRREAALLRRLDHPGVARILDAGTLPEGVPFIALELLDGSSLEAQRRARGGRLPVAEVLGYARQVLEVLIAVHALGVVHRDLKPSNVFVTMAGRLKLLDFGIASAGTDLPPGDDSASTTRGILGTPAFMAPEQARGRWDLVDARSDLWSVGAMIFTLASGEYVHVAGTENERLGLAMTRPARSLSQVAPSAPPSLVRIVGRALAYDRADRFQSAAEFLSALDADDCERAEHAGVASDVTLTDSVRTARPVAPTLTRAAWLLGLGALTAAVATGTVLVRREPPPVDIALGTVPRTPPADAGPAPRSPDTMSLKPQATTASVGPAAAMGSPATPREPSPRTTPTAAAQLPSESETIRAVEDLLDERTGTPGAASARDIDDPLERRD